MSRILADQPKIAIGVAVGVGLASAVGLFALYYRNKLLNTPPKKWRRVGEISDLMCFPIKSCGTIRLNKLNCELIGLGLGNLRDRVFMVTNTNGQFVTGRQHPTLVQIMPQIENDKMVLSAPGMIDIEVDIKRLYSVPSTKANVWGQQVDAIDAGEEVAKWISRFILTEDTGLRLVFYPNTEPTREVREKNQKFVTAKSNDTGALHDATSFMLMNENSIYELNSRLKEAVTALQFRPNFVVKGPEAFEEDSWDWIRIGNDTVFRNVKPCTRCIFTNIDPETARRHPDGEPLKTLMKYRVFTKLNEPTSPVMGIHLGIRVNGTVQLGDGVYVGDYN